MVHHHTVAPHAHHGSFRCDTHSLGMQERQFLIRQTRDLNKVKADLEELKPRNAETEEMLSKFEPGFSDRSLARVAELNAEVVQAKSHLKQVGTEISPLPVAFFVSVKSCMPSSVP